MDYLNRFKLVDKAEFRQRLQVAAWIAAAAVASEDSGTPNHTARLAWAKRALKGPLEADEMRLVAIRATANPAITEKSTDDDLQFVVNGMVDELAGSKVKDAVVSP